MLVSPIVHTMIPSVLHPLLHLLFLTITLGRRKAGDDFLFSQRASTDFGSYTSRYSSALVFFCLN